MIATAITLALLGVAAAIYGGYAIHRAQKAATASSAPLRPRRREYRVKAFIEIDNQSMYADGKTRTKVIVHNSDYDHRYQSLSKGAYEFIGSCDPMDRERVSELMTQAESRRNELEDALIYAQDAARALNMQP